MNFKKCSISLLLCLTMLCSLMAPAVFAYDNTDDTQYEQSRAEETTEPAVKIVTLSGSILDELSYAEETDDDTGTVGTFGITNETVEIGQAANTTGYIVYGPGYKYSLNEMIYLPEEIGTDGTVTKLAFHVGIAGAFTADDVKIYMGHSAKTAFTGTSDWVPAADMTLVYSASSATLGQTVGWETITLDTPFDYNGTDSLVIAVSAAKTTVNSAVKYTYSTQPSRSIYRTGTSASYAELTDTTAGNMPAAGSFVPDIQLTLEVCEHLNLVKGETVEPTCTGEGYTLYHCEDCDKDIKADLVPRTGHTWGEDGVCIDCGSTGEWDGVTTLEPFQDDGVYLIDEGAELAWFRDYVNVGNNTACARLTHNINMGENAWTPIGTGSSTTAQYNGTFDGGGYTVTLDSNTTASTAYQGLFGYVGQTGVIENVVLDGSITVTYNSALYLGGIAGRNAGRIESCVNQAKVYGTGSSGKYVGGIVGQNYSGDILNSVNEGAVTAECTGSNYAYAGGIFGYGNYSNAAQSNTVDRCYNVGSVSAVNASTSTSYNAAAGGIGGYWYGSSSYTRTISNCYSTGAISATSASATSANCKVGGVAGYIYVLSGLTAKTTLANCWYLEGTASAAYVPSSTSYAVSSDLTTVGEKTDAELKSTAFVTDSIQGYQSSCGGYPVLLWQTAVEHTMPESGSTRVEPTCTEDGYEGYVCTVCGETVGTVIPALGHDWDEGVVTAEPTCTEEGETTYTCQREGCGEVKTEPIEALGHAWDEGVVTAAATCTEDGVLTYTCTRDCCPDVTRTEAIPATGHTPLEGSEVEYETYYQYTCAVCGETYTVDKKWDGVSKDEPATDGDGVYLIGTGAELAWFADYVNAGNAAANARLTANLDMGDSWTPIGKYDYSAPVTYSGTFDGDNHTVTLNVNVTTLTGAGLFAYVDGATIQNLTVAGSVVTTLGPAGGIAALAKGHTSFINCHNEADVTGTTFVGGITGGVMFATNSTWSGSIAITGCSNSGAVTTTGTSNVGGIIASDGLYCPATITQCLNTGAVSRAENGTAGTVGGIVGTLYGMISTSANTGTVTCGVINHGGIVGYGVSITVTDCYNTGSLVNNRTTENSSKIGGIVGGVSSSATVRNSYNAGQIILNGASTTYLGGIAGQTTAGASNSYYLDTSVTGGTEIGTAKTEDELKSGEFLALLNGDAEEPSFKSDSTSKPINSGYPILTWQVVDDGTGDSEEKPSYEMYLVLTDAAGSELEDADGDGAYDVDPGDTFTLTLYVKSSSDQEMTGYDATISPDPLLTLSLVEEYSTVAYNRVGTITWFDFNTDPVSLTANEGYPVAVYNVTVAGAGTEGLAYGAAMNIGLTAGTVTDLNGDRAGIRTAAVSDSAVEITTTYTITWDPNNGDAEETTTVKYGETPAYEGTPTKDGYTFAGWQDAEGNAPGAAAADAGYTAQWEAVTYTITYQDTDGTVLGSDTYTIEDELTLNTTAAKEGQVLTGWTVAADSGSWTAGREIGLDEILSGMYGDVTLTAVWKGEVQFVVEDYAYAFTNGVLLIVAAPDPGTGYGYTYDGDAVFYTEDVNYTSRITDNPYTGVYVYIISADDYDETAEGDARYAAIEAKFAKTEGAVNETISRNGDVINGDGVKYDDITTVNEMVAGRTKWDDAVDVSIRSRLEADMSTDTEDAVDRGSIADVAAIIDIWLGN